MFSMPTTRFVRIATVTLLAAIGDLDAAEAVVPGMGLSIAKMLVEAQGGRIDFESEPGRQTRFWIDLPLAA